MNIDEETAKSSMLGIGMPDWMVEVFMQFNKKCREGHVAINTDDVIIILRRSPNYFETHIFNNKDQFKLACIIHKKL